MKRLILHIGMPKTGTTSIQEAFAQLETPDFRYAHLNFWGNHSEALGTIFHKDPSRAMNHDLFQRNAKQVRRKRRKFNVRFERELARPEQTVMMSGELVSRFSISEARRLVKRVQKSGRELFVVAFLRDPISYASSLFQEVLKSFHSQNCRVKLTNYRALLQPWRDLVDREHLIVEQFNPSTFVGGSVINHMAHLFDLPEPPSVTPKNSGLSDPVLRLLWRFSGLNLPQPHTWPQVLRRRHFVDVLNAGIPGDKFQVPPSALRLPPRLERQVNWLNENYGIDFSDAVEKVRGKTWAEPLSDALAEISPETQAALTRLLHARGITTPQDATLDENLRRLYDSFRSTDILRAGWALLTEDDGARLRRNLRERLRRPFG